MKIYEITFSPTGGTKRVSDILAASFPGEKEEIDLLNKDADYGAYNFQQEDVCLIAVPSFGGRVPETAVERIQSMKGNSARAVLVCVYGNRAYEDTLLELKNAAKKAGFHPVAAVAAVAEHSIMHQFAAGRPDADDEAELRAFADSIWKKLDSENQMDEVTVPGNEPYKEFKGSSMKPIVGEACNGCSLCAKHCPVGAIDPQAPNKTDEEQCISCMGCIAVCPQKARHLNAQMVAGVSEKMAPLFADGKENQLFL